MHLVSPGSNESVRDVIPHLMPFHIGYSGSAPVSTYFHAKPLDVRTGSGPGGDTSAAAVTGTSGPQNSAGGESSTKDAYTAAFRGRSVHGSRILLPEGYSGYVLQSNEPAATAASEASLKRKRTETVSQPAKKNRRLRRTRSVVVKEETEDDIYALMSRVEDEIEVEEVTPAIETVAPTREFTPIGKFDSIMVWHPDVPVDHGQDEYIRAIDEWAKLSNTLHDF
ncbi:ribonuclease H2, subunit C [Cantharellus anzutake]|uniref:ribonuclease H2, subunit C n=1 Tax=Cantharellus anzutake TaxID=1750568 RepID=UPI001902EA15|nr:ribonuclease H2, subunit C [Cantharellus anzutake]KAF8328387.1 ribonuclease H2, subunit C [Cantharellus anzutake]